MDLALSSINFKTKHILFGIIISIFFLVVIYLYAIYYSYNTEFNLDSKTIELYKQKVNDRSECKAGIKLAIYYAEIKKDKKLAESWMNKVSECRTLRSSNKLQD